MKKLLLLMLLLPTLVFGQTFPDFTQIENKPFVNAADKGFSILKAGAANATALRLAVTALGGKGGTIVLPAGDFSLALSSPIELNTSEGFIRLQGQGDNSTILNITMNYVGAAFTSDIANPTNCGLAVEGISFRDNSTVVTGTTCFYLTRTNSATGLRSWGARANFTNCSFFYFTYAGIHGIEAFNCQFVDCYFVGISEAADNYDINDDAGIRLWGADGTLTPQSHTFSNLISIKNCVFLKMRYGVNLWNTLGADINSSTFESLGIGLIVQADPTVSPASVSTALGSTGLSFASMGGNWFEKIQVAFAVPKSITWATKAVVANTAGAITQYNTNFFDGSATISNPELDGYPFQNASTPLASVNNLTRQGRVASITAAAPLNLFHTPTYNHPTKGDYTPFAVTTKWVEVNDLLKIGPTTDSFILGALGTSTPQLGMIWRRASSNDLYYCKETGKGLSLIPLALTRAQTDAGVKGQITYDTNYLYICVADNTWIRFAKTAW